MADPPTPASHGTLASHLSCPHSELQAEGTSELPAGNWVMEQWRDLGDEDHWAFLGLRHGRDCPRLQKMPPFYIWFICTST